MWGEKRQVIKSVTECSGFDRSRFASLSSMRQKVDTIATGCWMMTCATLWNNQLEKPQTTTIGRALSFCQQVMANEKAATVERRITTATDKAQVTSGYEEFVKHLKEIVINPPEGLSKEKKNFFYDARSCAKEHWK